MTRTPEPRFASVRLLGTRTLVPLLAVLGLAGLAWLGARAPGAAPLFGAVLPYGAALAFLGGMIWRVVSWARSPVPFNITTTCGQQHSLPWIRSSRLGNPHTRWGVVGRVLLETLLFRSLLHNVKHEWVESAGGEPRLIYRASPWLWLGALTFHYSLLVVFARHARFFLEPVPAWLSVILDADAFLRVGPVAFFLTGALLTAALFFLLVRRLWSPWLRHLSLPADYFPLFLLLGIALSGGWLRYSSGQVDVPAVKDFGVSLVQLRPALPAGIAPLFCVHLTLVCVLFAYLPFSKLAHMASLPLSPTRNLRGATRMVHHENPWNHPVHVHSYAEYENEFRDKMKAAGIPLDREAS